MAPKFSASGKRLGRPPKNKSAGTTFVTTPEQIKKEEEIFVIPAEEAESVIQCEFIPIQQWSHVKSEELKHGRYLTSSYRISDYGTKRWVIGGYLKADWKKYKVLRWHDSEILKRCINYLNSITVNKKGKRKYGNLELFNFKFLKKFGEEVAVVELIIDDRKNDNFWGEGERI